MSRASRPMLSLTSIPLDEFGPSTAVKPGPGWEFLLFHVSATRGHVVLNLALLPPGGNADHEW